MDTVMYLTDLRASRYFTDNVLPNMLNDIKNAGVAPVFFHDRRPPLIKPRSIACKCTFLSAEMYASVQALGIHVREIIRKHCSTAFGAVGRRAHVEVVHVQAIPIPLPDDMVPKKRRRRHKKGTRKLVGKKHTSRSRKKSSKHRN